MRCSESTLVKDVMSSPEVLDQLNTRMQAARDGCAVAAIYEINGNDTVAKARDRLLAQSPMVALIAVKRMGEFIPEHIVDDLLKHIATDERARNKAMIRIKNLTEQQKEILRGNS